MNSTMTTDRDGVLETDYLRQLVRSPPSSPPSAADIPAHLVWVKLMAQVLVGLEEWAPHFTTALAAHYRSIEGFRPYCESGEYERAYADRVPHALSFLRFFMGASEPAWLKDVARCEVWAASLRGTIPSEHRDRLREILRIEARGGKEFAVVSHDPLETLQHLVGYADTSMSRAGRLLWFLSVAPIYPTPRPKARPGIVVFQGAGSDVGMSYLPVEESAGQ